MTIGARIRGLIRRQVKRTPRQRAQPANGLNMLTRSTGSTYTWGGYCEIYSPRVLHRWSLFPAVIDCGRSGCAFGGADGHAAQPLPSVTLFLLPAAGLRSAGGSLYGVDWNIYYTNLERLECWSVGVLELWNDRRIERSEIPKSKGQITNKSQWPKINLQNPHMTLKKEHTNLKSLFIDYCDLGFKQLVIAIWYL